jgi:hypothetical protein
MFLAASLRHPAGGGEQVVEKLLITKADSVVLPGHVVRPETFAEALDLLTINCRAYTATLRWQTWFGPWQKQYMAVCNEDTPLARLGKNGKYELLITDSHTLQSIVLTVFYQDGSSLVVSLGDSDRISIVPHGTNPEARHRLEQVQAVFKKRRMHPDVVAAITVVSLLVGVAALLSALGAAVAAGVMVYVTLGAAMVSPLVLGSGGIRPRPSRIGAGWSAMGWSKEDLRRLITAVVAGLVIFGFGLWVGRS